MRAKKKNVDVINERSSVNNFRINLTRVLKVHKFLPSHAIKSKYKNKTKVQKYDKSRITKEVINIEGEKNNEKRFWKNFWKHNYHYGNKIKSKHTKSRQKQLYDFAGALKNTEKVINEEV